MCSSELSARVLLITVHYKTTDGVLAAFVESVRRLHASASLDVIVVDNSPYKNGLGVREAMTAIPNAELLESSTNRGYFGAARFAFHHYLAEGHSLPNWVIVCNHDILIQDESFFERLFAYDPAAVGVLAPRITVPSQGLEQNPFMTERPGRWRRFTMRLYSAAYPLGVTWDWLSRCKRALLSRVPSWTSGRQDAGGRRRIYAAHGAFMIFSRRFFEAGGVLDDGSFLFGEEIAVGETCRLLGLPVIYDPSLSVLHNEHQSVGKGMSRLMYGYHRKAVRHVLSKYLMS